MSAVVDCSIKDLSAEDFFKKFIRTNGSGSFALAIVDVTASGTWTEMDCVDKEISWEDIVKLVATATADGGIGINTVHV